MRAVLLAVRAKHSKVCLKMIKGQYAPAQLELARLRSSLLYGTRVILVSMETVNMLKS